MKKVLLVALLALALPAVAFSANPFGDLKSGTYTGTMKSIVPEMNGQTVKMELNNDQSNSTATVTFKDGTVEKWNFNDKTLKQSELDIKLNKTVMEYLATASTTSPGRVVYNVNCKDATKKECDAGIDSRANWTMEKGKDALTYRYFGVARADSFKNEVKPSERIVITFNYTDPKNTK